MVQEDLYKAIFKRRSVRKYAGPLDDGAMEEMQGFMSALKPMLPDIRTELKVLSSVDVKGMFKVDAPHFLAFFSETKQGYLTNAGFMLQQMDLFFSANGIGSCWQGGPRPIRDTMNLSDLEFVILLAFGRPAEEVQRQSVAEFKRQPLEKIASVSGLKELMEPLRLAPSGMNNQPWYFIERDGRIDAYCARSPLVDHMNRISLGIALCHLWLAAEQVGRSVSFASSEPGASNAPSKYVYLVTATLS